MLVLVTCPPLMASAHKLGFLGEQAACADWTVKVITSVVVKKTVIIATIATIENFSYTTTWTNHISSIVIYFIAISVILP